MRYEWCPKVAGEFGVGVSVVEADSVAELLDIPQFLDPIIAKISLAVKGDDGKLFWCLVWRWP